MELTAPAAERSANDLESISRLAFPRYAGQETVAMDATKTEGFAHIGKSVIIKGELSGSEDLYVDGVVEGTIELQSNSLVVGPNGQVRAKVNAKNVTVQGRVEGNIRAIERVELRKSAVIVGDISTQRVAIEEGAYFKGKIDIQRDADKASSKSESRAEAAGT
jgi:cytoskeletal protein CcmA (bactofilin family)